MWKRPAGATARRRGRLLAGLPCSLVRRRGRCGSPQRPGRPPAAPRDRRLVRSRGNTPPSGRRSSTPRRSRRARRCWPRRCASRPTSGGSRSGRRGPRPASAADPCPPAPAAPRAAGPAGAGGRSAAAIPAPPSPSRRPAAPPGAPTVAIPRPAGPGRSGPAWTRRRPAGPTCNGPAPAGGGRRRSARRPAPACIPRRRGGS